MATFNQHGPAQTHRIRVIDHVINEIVQSIASGKVQAGQKLPTEYTLMKQLGVGRSSVREAIGILTFVGLLTIRAGMGTYLNDNVEEFLTRPLSWGIPLGSARIQELVEARAIIEEGLVVLATQRASEADIKYIKSCLDHQTRVKKNRSKMIRSGMAFHNALAKATNNEVLISVYQQLRNLNRRWREETYIVPGRYEVSLKEHEEIFNAVKSHDVRAARRAIRRHIKSSQRALDSAARLKATGQICQKPPSLIHP